METKIWLDYWKSLSKEEQKLLNEEYTKIHVIDYWEKI